MFEDTKPNDYNCYPICGGSTTYPCKDDKGQPPVCQIVCTKGCGYRDGTCSLDGKECCCRK